MSLMDRNAGENDRRRNQHAQNTQTNVCLGKIHDVRITLERLKDVKALTVDNLGLQSGFGGGVFVCLFAIEAKKDTAWEENAPSYLGLARGNQEGVARLCEVHVADGVATGSEGRISIVLAQGP